jgi:hypothetical protein
MGDPEGNAAEPADHLASAEVSCRQPGTEANAERRATNSPNLNETKPVDIRDGQHPPASTALVLGNYDLRPIRRCNPHSRNALSATRRIPRN